METKAYTLFRPLRLFERPESHAVWLEPNVLVRRRRGNANGRLGMKADVLVIAGRHGVQLDLPHEHRPARQALDRQLKLGGLLGEIPHQQAVDAIVRIVRGQAMQAGAASVEAQPLPGQP